MDKESVIITTFLIPIGLTPDVLIGFFIDSGSKRVNTCLVQFAIIFVISLKGYGHESFVVHKGNSSIFEFLHETTS